MININLWGLDSVQILGVLMLITITISLFVINHKLNKKD